MFTAEKSLDNPCTSSCSFSSTGEQNQVATNDSLYSPSLMQRLNFYYNYQGVLDVQISAPNYGMNLEFGAQDPALYNYFNHPHSTVTSFNINGETELYFEAISAHLASLYEVVNISPYHKSKILCKYFIFHPYVVMVNPETYMDFLSLLDDCNDQVLNGTLEKMAEFPDDFLVAVSCHMFGSQVIKKLIMVARRAPIISMFPRVFAAGIVVIMNSQFGWRVIEASLKSLDNLTNEPLYEEVIRHCLEIATSKYGCIAIQNFMEFINSSPSQPYYGQGSANAYSPKEHLFKAILNHTASLAENYYGTFVLRFLIERCSKDCLEAIAVGLKPLYERLCTSENGKYLVQKILRTPYRNLVAEALLDCDRLVMIAHDANGSSSLCTLLMKMKKHKADYYQKLCEKLSQDLGTLQSSIHGKKVAYWVKRSVERRCQ